jgi:HlyD family secretion protein
MLKKIALNLAALTLAAAFAGTLYFLWRKSEKKPVVYDSSSPFLASIVKKAVATGSVVPRVEVAIKPQVSGIVDHLFVEPGQRVEKGALVARVVIVPDMINLATAESRLNRAGISLENAELEHRRNRDLFDQGVIAAAVLQTYETDLLNAREELAAAEDGLALIRDGARKRSAITTNTLVKATSAGMVLEVPVEVGDSVIEANTFNDGTTIATVAEMKEMVFEGFVDESEVGKLREGMELLLTVGAIDREQFAATLEYIAPKGVEVEGAIQFEIRAAMELREGHFIRANYSANADIVLDRRDGVLAIQESWLQFDGDEGDPYVEVEVAAQRFERRPIETGLSDGITIQVVSGLREDERIKDPNSAQTAG